MITLQVVPFSEIQGLSSVGRIRKLLNIAKENKIVLLQGRLKKEEETELIKTTMEEINKDFKGIELAVIDNSKNGGMSPFQKIKQGFANMLVGDMTGFTIIGPASVVKEIKKNPNKIELMMTGNGSRRPRGKNKRRY